MAQDERIANTVGRHNTAGASYQRQAEELVQRPTRSPADSAVKPSPRGGDRVAARAAHGRAAAPSMASGADAAGVCATRTLPLYLCRFFVQRRETRPVSRPEQFFNRSVPRFWG